MSRRRSLHRAAAPALALAALATVAGCAAPLAHRWASNDLCPARSVAILDGSPPTDDAVLALLLDGFDPGTRRATSPAVDCTGARVVWTAPARACGEPAPAAGGEPAPAGRIGPDAIVRTALGPGQWLVWVMTGRHAAGDAIGPVAVVEVEVERRRWAVRALGALRAYPDRLQLRLVQLGVQEVLVAEGDACAGPGQPCARVARLVLLDGDRFAPAPIRSRSGACVSAALVDLARQEDVRAAGRPRRLEVESRLAFEPGAIRVDELAWLREHPVAGGAPGAVLHRAQDSRRIEVSGAGLTTDRPPVWARMSAVADDP